MTERIRVLKAPDQTTALLYLGEGSEYDIVVFHRGSATIVHTRVGIDVFQNYKWSPQKLVSRGAYGRYLIPDRTSQVAVWLKAEALLTFKFALVTSEAEGAEVLSEGKVNFVILVTAEGDVEHCHILYRDRESGKWLPSDWTEYNVEGVLGRTAQITLENLYAYLEDIADMKEVRITD
jgi:hypothetical protein